jgi:tRNA A37 threonylcarbamoyladenosine modification protein TsaB
MYLLIDLSQRDTIDLTFFTTETLEHKKYQRQNRELLVSIEEALTQLGVEKSAIAGIMVVVGTGSFTNTRLAVTVANTWGHANNIPLLAIKASQIEEAQQLIPLLESQPKGQYISATYSGEPNIGKKKDA